MGFNAQAGQTKQQTQQITTGFQALNRVSGQLLGSFNSLRAMAEGGLDWGTVIEQTWNLGETLKSMHGSMSKVPGVARAVTLAFTGIGAAVAIAGTGLIGYGVMVFRFAREMKELGNSARSAGMSFQMMFHMSEQMKKFGATTEQVIRSAQGVQAVLADMQHANSQVRQTLVQHGADQTFLRRWQQETNAIRQQNIALDEARKIYDAQMAQPNADPRVALANAQFLGRQLGYEIESFTKFLLSNRRVAEMTPAEAARAALIEKHTDKIAEQWKIIKNRMYYVVRCFQNSGIGGPWPCPRRNQHCT